MVECEDGDCRARVVDVVRVGDDQALVLEPEQGELHEGERVVARVDPAHRRPTASNHTATHLLHAALRATLGGARAPGRAPTSARTSCASTSPTARRVSAEELRDVEDQVNEWVLANHPVRAITTTLDEAKALGATALFGEKYGDVVRMVEVGDGSWSRELCGGTHVRSTAEIGLFKVTQETSSAANVRRIEAVTGPVAVAAAARARPRAGRGGGACCGRRPRTSRPRRPTARRSGASSRSSSRRAAAAGRDGVSPDAAEDVGGARVLVAQAAFEDPKAMPDAADKLRGQLGDPSVVVLGSAAGGRVSLLVAASPGAVERGVKAGAIVKAAAQVVGGGGGGRDSLAQAGGRDPDKLPEALETARAEIAAASRVRVVR